MKNWNFNKGKIQAVIEWEEQISASSRVFFSKFSNIIGVRTALKVKYIGSLKNIPQYYPFRHLTQPMHSISIATTLCSEFADYRLKFKLIESQILCKIDYCDSFDFGFQGVDLHLQRFKFFLMKLINLYIPLYCRLRIKPIHILQFANNKTWSEILPLCTWSNMLWFLKKNNIWSLALVEYTHREI